MKPILYLLIALTSLPIALGAQAQAAEGEACPLTMSLTMLEMDAIKMFHANLSHLLYKYGKPDFNEALENIVRESWPQTRLVQVSPSFYERAVNMVDQARLTNSIALTIGTDGDDWYRFEREMGQITMVDAYADNRRNAFEKRATRIIEAIKNSEPSRKLGVTREQYELIKAEAIARTADMYIYLMRWSMINRGLIDERAAASARKMAVIGIGAVGAGVLISTFAVASPLVATAGVTAGALSADPVVAALLMKLGEAAAGSLLGMAGAPATHLILDANHTLSEAGKNSANRQTSYACELGSEMRKWKDHGASPYLSAAVFGGALGFGGGALTFSRASAQIVLYATGFGVGVAQLYSLGKMTQLEIDSLAYYKLAEEAEAAGEHDKALQLLYKSRDLAQQAREKGLESIIIGVLSTYLAKDFPHAMREGEKAIRVLYANSADTMPLAGKAALNVIPHRSTVPLAQENER